MTTHEDTPERRYVWLHRAIERGNSTDNIWAELCRVCYRLGYKDEAVRGAQNIRNPELRRQAEMFLIQKGLLARPSESSTPAVEESDHRPTLQEEVTDAFGYLFLEHLPLTIMAATLTFPLVLGLGGVLTTGTELWVFPAIACLPILGVLGIVGAMARRILLEASRGADEPPGFPELTKLAPTATRFLGDNLAVMGLFLGPACLSMWLGFPGLTAGLFALGILAMPMAITLRQARNDWRSLSPMVLVPAMARMGKYYGLMVVANVLLFLPAIGAFWATTGSDLYLRLSFLGPLIITPLFLSSRLMGRALFLHRKDLGELIEDATGQLDGELSSLAPEHIETYDGAQMSSRTANKPRVPKRRAAESPRPRAETPAPAPTNAASPQVRRNVRDAVAQRAANMDSTEQNTTARARTERQKLQEAQNQQRAQSERQKQRRTAPQPQQSPMATVEEIPDLANLPGAQVLRGDERQNAGAAAALASRIMRTS